MRSLSSERRFSGCFVGAPRETRNFDESMADPDASAALAKTCGVTRKRRCHKGYGIASFRRGKQLRSCLKWKPAGATTSSGEQVTRRRNQFSFTTGSRLSDARPPGCALRRGHRAGQSRLSASMSSWVHHLPDFRMGSAYRCLSAAKQETGNSPS
jgi:hypothetical protein